jgi:hypothetical protein
MAKQGSHDEALELLRTAAMNGNNQAIIAYERALWRRERDAAEDGKKGGRKSAATKILDDLLDEDEE